MDEDIDQYLRQKYYDLGKEGSLGGVDALYRAVKEDKNRSVSRGQIEEWLKRGNPISPCSKKPLQLSDLRPNIALRKLIEEWQTNRNL